MQTAPQYTGIMALGTEVRFIFAVKEFYAAICRNFSWQLVEMRWRRPSG